MRLVKILLATALVLDAALVMASPDAAAASPSMTFGLNNSSVAGSFSQAVVAIATPE